MGALESIHAVIGLGGFALGVMAQALIVEHSRARRLRRRRLCLNTVPRPVGAAWCRHTPADDPKQEDTAR